MEGEPVRQKEESRRGDRGGRGHIFSTSFLKLAASFTLTME